MRYDYFLAILSTSLVLSTPTRSLEQDEDTAANQLGNNGNFLNLRSLISNKLEKNSRLEDYCSGATPITDGKGTVCTNCSCANVIVPYQHREPSRVSISMAGFHPE